MMPHPSSRRTGPGAASRAWTSLELLLGAVLLGAAALAGLMLARRPGPNRVDAAGYFYVPADASSHLATELVKIGSRPVLLIGVAVVVLVAVFQDWVRAVACGFAPIVAVLIVEHVAKPMVGREIGAGGFTYPSGTVTAAAALAAAAFLVAPRFLRPLAALVGAVAIVGVSVGVLMLRWHYLTDVFGGICVGVGAVFFIDAIAHVPWLIVRRRRLTDQRLRVMPVRPPVHA